MRLDAEGADVPRGGQHRAVKILAQLTDAIHGDLAAGTVTKQLRLILPALFFKVCNGFLARPDFLFKRQILRCKRAHILFDGARHVVPHLALGQPHIQAVTHRVHHAHVFVRIQPLHAQQEQKAQRALVHTAAFLVLIGKRSQFGVLLKRFAQLHAHAAAHGAQHLRRAFGRKRMYGLHHLYAGGKRPLLSVNGYMNLIAHGASSRLVQASSKGMLLMNVSDRSSTSTWS